MSPKQIADALFALTYEQANEYKQQQDQYCWVQYAILDPQDIPRSYTEVFEDRLEALYADQLVTDDEIDYGARLIPV